MPAGWTWAAALAHSLGPFSTGALLGSICAIDPSTPQIERAIRQLSGTGADFRMADVQALPFGDAAFEFVVSALTINFVPDRARALSEMCRVVHPGGFVAGYVWDFAEERSPSWPMRAGLRSVGIDLPEIPGTTSCRLDALAALFAGAGLGNVSSTSIEVAVSFVDFDDFWQAQTSSFSPTTKIISGMTGRERKDLIRAVRAALPQNSQKAIRYSARANAIKGRVRNWLISDGSARSVRFG